MQQCAQSCLILCDPWTVAHQAPLSMGIPRQEYGSGLPFPSPGNLPDPCLLHWQADSLLHSIEQKKKKKNTLQNIGYLYYNSTIIIQKYQYDLIIFKIDRNVCTNGVKYIHSF